MVLAILFRSARGFVFHGSSRRQVFRPELFLRVASLSSTSATPLSATPVEDASAFSKSRQPFSMPSNAPDDSKSDPTLESSTKGGSSGDDSLAWNSLGLWTELVQALQEEMHLRRPTAVQQLVIPHMLDEKSSHLTFLAATGSGKTLAYSLPLLQKVKQSEVFGHENGLERRPKRPVLLILAPTRELAAQISTDSIKKLCHKIKLSSTVLTGKDDYGKQRRALNRPIDIVVATPGRFLQHWRDHNVHIGSLKYVVLDEMDTMLEQGFAKELRQILYPALYKKKAEQSIDVDKDLLPDAPHIIMTSATMTQTIQRMVGDTDKVGARKHFVKRNNDDDNDAPNANPRGLVLPRMPVYKAKGLHKAVPRLQQVFVDVGSSDKLSLITDIVGHGGSGAALRSRGSSSEWAANALTMIFCNTAASCRAVQYALSEAQIETLAYHGDLNSEARTENLRRFRLAGSEGDDSTHPRILVCTDLAARGLDVPQVDHVVMFDFPLNSLDYLHRSGRTARGDRTGGRVTALVSKRDRVLANGIERAVQNGEPLDGLSSRKSDYQPGGRLHSSRTATNNRQKKRSSSPRGGPQRQTNTRRSSR